MNNQLTIRTEQAQDTDAIEYINRVAFKGEEEARLVDALRVSGCEYISLVAEKGRRLIGHILFTPVKLKGDEFNLKILGLAPMAVLPSIKTRVLAVLWSNRFLRSVKPGAMMLL